LAAADICVGERTLLGSYSADIDLQAESARLVFGGDLHLEELISDKLSLDEIENGIRIAQSPSEQSLKVVIHPQETA
jgi:L-iditol 2-dehydrogenase